MSQRRTGGIWMAWVCLAALISSGGRAVASGRLAQKASEPNLSALLDKLTVYAARLESSVLDFVCREEIQEKINSALDVKAISRRANLYKTPTPVKKHYVYDYQCVRGKNGLIRETRTLLDDNGKKANIPEAKLKTEVFVFGHAPPGPGWHLRRALPPFLRV